MHCSIFYRTGKLAGGLSEVEMVSFKFVFLLNVSKDITVCLFCPVDYFFVVTLLKYQFHWILELLVIFSRATKEDFL